MLLVGKERILLILPSISKAFDGVIVLLLSHGNNKVVILDGLAISEGDAVFFGGDLLNSNTIAVTIIFTDQLSGSRKVFISGEATSCLNYHAYSYKSRCPLNSVLVWS